MVVKTYRQRPGWVDEEIFIQDLLNLFIDKVDRGVKPQVRVNAKNTPQLYDFNNEDTHYLWGLVTVLDNEYHILTVKLSRVKAGQETYDNAQLLFNVDSELMVRDWLQRPVFDPYASIWHNEVAKYAHQFDDGGRALSDHIIHHADKRAEDIVYGFSLLRNQLHRPLTLRALSARCFWGDSKFLDKREVLVRELLPSLSVNIIIRPLLINVYIPERFSHVLFIENQDSFLQLVANARRCVALQGCALVYSAGFRGSSSRVRTPQAAVFSHLTAFKDHDRERFEKWWFCNGETIPCFFWGDMDFAGMAILAALKKTFSNIQAWQCGYDAMQKYYHSGVHHKPSSTGRQRQKDPEVTGCEYADNVLLPLIRATGEFLDQEVVDAGELIVS